MPLREQCCRTCDVRRGKARPVENRVLVTGELRERRREDLGAGTHHVGLQRVSERREPARREARRHACPRRRYLERVPGEAHGDRAATPCGGRADPRAVEIGDRAARKPGEEGERGIPRAVLGDDQSGRTGLARARGLHAVGTAAAADECDRAAQRSRRCRVAQLTVDAADRSDVEEPLVGRDPRRRHVVRRSEGHPTDAAGSEHRHRRAEDVSVRNRADADRIRRGCGRARSPEAEEVTVVSGRDDRHDAGADDIRNGLDEDVRPRVRLRATAREVDDVHAVAHRSLEGRDDLRAVRRTAAAERRGRGNVEDAVVPDVRAGRDTLEVVHCGMATARRLDAEAGLAGLDVRLDSCDHARHVRSVEGAVAVERRAVRSRPCESARDDHLRRGRARRSLRESGRIREAGGIEERMLVIDAVVDDRDLDALSARARKTRERRCTEHGGPTVQVQPIRVARVDVADGFCVQELREFRVRHAHGEPVDEHLIAPAHLRLGNLLADARNRLCLSRFEASEVGARERRRQIELDVAAEARKATGERGGRERRVVECDDDAHAIACVSRDAGVVGRRLHLHQRLLDDVAGRAVERSRGCPGNGDGSEERDEER